MLPTPRQVFKEQFCDADASMASIMQTFTKPCQAIPDQNVGAL
jgi:hypothetical protein